MKPLLIFLFTIIIAFTSNVAAAEDKAAAKETAKTTPHIAPIIAYPTPYNHFKAMRQAARDRMKYHRDRVKS